MTEPLVDAIARVLYTYAVVGWTYADAEEAAEAVAALFEPITVGMGTHVIGYRLLGGLASESDYGGSPPESEG